MPCGDNAHRRADDQRQNCRGEPQQDSRADFFADHIVDRALVNDGRTQVTLNRVGQVCKVLFREALVQPPFFFQGSLKDRIIVVLSQKRPDGVARR